MVLCLLMKIGYHRRSSRASILFIPEPVYCRSLYVMRVQRNYLFSVGDCGSDDCMPIGSLLLQRVYEMGERRGVLAR